METKLYRYSDGNTYTDNLSLSEAKKFQRLQNGGTITPMPKAVGHAPGPWRVQHEQATHGKNKCVVAGDAFIVARIPFGEVCDEANARLIAAAPELLAALEASERELTAYTLLGRTIVDSRFTGDWNRLSRAIIAARDAIAKAEGKQ